MPKVKIMPEGETPSNETLPPMPGSGEGSGPSSPSTGLGAISEPEGVAVDPQLAAELVNLPYEGWAIFEKRIPREEIVLSENLKTFLGGPVARVMTKYGLGKIAKDEVVIIITLSAHTFAVISALRKAKSKEQDIPKEVEK